MRIRHDDLLTADRQPPVFAAIRATFVWGRDGQVSLSQKSGVSSPPSRNWKRARSVRSAVVS